VLVLVLKIKEGASERHDGGWDRRVEMGGDPSFECRWAHWARTSGRWGAGTSGQNEWSGLSAPEMKWEKWRRGRGTKDEPRPTK